MFKFFKKETPEKIRARLNSLTVLEEINLGWERQTKDLKELIKIEERLREIRTERNILNNKLTNKLFGL